MARKPETNQQARLLVYASKIAKDHGIKIRAMRNNNGVAKYKASDGTTRVVRYGLGNGTGDIIGWRTETITPDMVGQKIARFMSWETKYGDGKEEADQVQFRQEVTEAGGLAFVARTELDVFENLMGFAEKLYQTLN